MMEQVNEVRISGCQDGYFMRQPGCREWLSWYAEYLIKRLGISTRLRMYAYRTFDGTWVALDAFNADNDSIALTILVAPGEILLPASSEITNQFDIVLPGIIDVFSLVGSLSNFLSGKEGTDEIWISHSPYSGE